uniref:Uncharacterized protein n=1 Tax=Arundo donax TaxID=35708 RepID=A0A0A9D7X1_ARUDO
MGRVFPPCSPHARGCVISTSSRCSWLAPSSTATAPMHSGALPACCMFLQSCSVVLGFNSGSSGGVSQHHQITNGKAWTSCVMPSSVILI